MEIEGGKKKEYKTSGSDFYEYPEGYNITSHSAIICAYTSTTSLVNFRCSSQIFYSLPYAALAAVAVRNTIHS